MRNHEEVPYSDYESGGQGFESLRARHSVYIADLAHGLDIRPSKVENLAFAPALRASSVK